MLPRAPVEWVVTSENPGRVAAQLPSMRAIASSGLYVPDGTPGAVPQGPSEIPGVLIQRR